MELTKEALSKIGKALVIEAKQEGSKEYQEGYSNGVFDFYNHLLKVIKKGK
jgi:hypothetical protein